MLCRNVLFYLGIIPCTVLLSTLGYLFFFLPYQGRYWIITRWSYFYIFWAKITCGLHYTVEGMENIPKKNAIVLANHQSSWETIFLQVLLPPQCWVLKKELLFIPGFGWALALLEPISIQRNQLNSVKEILKQGKQRLKTGRWVVIFPEGTRSTPNTLRRFSRSGAALAEASGYKVVPIAHNAGEFWPRGFCIRKPGTIRVVIGESIDPQGKTVTEINQMAETWIQNQLNLLKIQNATLPK